MGNQLRETLSGRIVERTNTIIDDDEIVLRTLGFCESNASHNIATYIIPGFHSIHG